jgi:uncharacterized protein
VAVVLDTSVVVALVVADEPDHEDVRRWISEVDDDLITTPLALAEIDHVVERRAGWVVLTRVWQDFDRGAYQVRWWADALQETLRIVRTEQRMNLGIVDASLVALAERLGTDRIATLDHRHFRTLTLRSGKHFTVLPADA